MHHGIKHRDNHPKIWRLKGSDSYLLLVFFLSLLGQDQRLQWVATFTTEYLGHQGVTLGKNSETRGDAVKIVVGDVLKSIQQTNDEMVDILNPLGHNS